MKFDNILQIVGEFGKFQKLVYAIVCVIVFTGSWISMIQVFISASVDHWCAVKEWDAYNCSEDGLSSQDCELAKKNASIPANYSETGELVYEECKKYDVSAVEFRPGLDPTNYSEGLGSSHTIMRCDQGWVYDVTQYKSSTVTDFDLVCEKKDLAQASQTVYYGGFLAGSIIFGFLSDLIGRWWTLFICMVVRLVSGTLLAFSTDWWMFALLRFFQGMAAISIYIIAFVIGTEYVGPSRRNVAGILFCIPFSLGYMCLALLAYLIPYWRTLELVATAPTVALMILMLFLPESARWLISVGKYDKAEKTVIKIASVNKATAPEPVFTEEFKKEQDMIREKYKPTILDLFRTRSVCLRSIKLIFCWMVNALVYHGLSLNSSNLGVNDYVSFAILGAVEMPAYVLTMFTVEIFGRKPTLSGLFLLGGVACLITTVTPAGVWLTTVATIGKFGISGSFSVAYLYTAELYPTEIRTVAVGTCSMFSRVANMLSPIILTLERYWAPLPLAIFGSSAVVAGLLALLLPETKGMQLPETRHEGEEFGRHEAAVSEEGEKMETIKGNEKVLTDIASAVDETSNHVNPAFVTNE